MQITKTYFSRNGSHLTDADAEAIGPELEHLGEEWKARAADIVAAARSEHSSLHRYFEWRDPVAAQKYREWQARRMAGSIMVRIVQGGEEYETRAFHAVLVEQGDESEQDRDRSYISVTKIGEEELLGAQVIDEARKQLQGWKTRYAVYRHIFSRFEEEMGPVLDAIENAEKREAVVAAV